MNIVIMGAGAVGSFFGGLLSTKNNLVLVGRKKHVDTINKKGLVIKGKTKKKIKLKAVETVDHIDFIPDLIVLTVKSYDTEEAMRQVKKIIGSNTFVMSLQNGLDNIEKIQKYVSFEKILLCITTHGIVFEKPGVIIHTGIGKTLIGNISSSNSGIVSQLSNDLSNVGIKTKISNYIMREMWIKAIVNSSINPLTSIFNCKNGYLQKNIVLKEIVDRICKESTQIANSEKIDVRYDNMIKKTHEVISDTSENYSSMLQSIKNNKKTEIDSINGVFIRIAEKNNVDCLLNKTIVNLIKK